MKEHILATLLEWFAAQEVYLGKANYFDGGDARSCEIDGDYDLTALAERLAGLVEGERSA